jgi:uncharacterized membrane protein
MKDHDNPFFLTIVSVVLVAITVHFHFFEGGTEDLDRVTGDSWHWVRWGLVLASVFMVATTVSVWREAIRRRRRY